MGLKPSKVLCCSPDQHSVSLNLSTDVSQKQLLDDEPIIYSHFSISQKSEKLEVTIKPYTNMLQLSKNESVEWPCIFELNPPIEDSRQGIDIVYIIELSSQISSIWLNTIKKCIWYSLSKLNNYDRVCIIGFNEYAVKLCPLSSVNKTSNKIYNCIKNLESCGNSNIFEGISLGLNVLSHRRMSNAISAIMLFSKGAEDFDKVRSLLHNIGISTNFYLHTFGLGDHFSEFLNGLSDECKGNYYNIPHPMTLTQAFGSCFGELLSIYAENLKIAVELMPSPIPLTLEKVYISEAHIIFGKSTDICAVLNILPSFKNFSELNNVKILKLSMKYKILRTGEEIKSEYFLELPCYSYDFLYENTLEINHNVLLSMFRFKLTDILYEILFEDSISASNLLSGFNEIIKYENEEGWVLQLKEEVKNYENLLKLGWSPPLKARILCSIEGYYNKSLFYIHDFQTPLQLDHQRMCKEALEAMRNNVRIPTQ